MKLRVLRTLIARIPEEYDDTAVEVIVNNAYHPIIAITAPGMDATTVLHASESSWRNYLYVTPDGMACAIWAESLEVAKREAPPDTILVMEIKKSI